VVPFHHAGVRVPERLGRHHRRRPAITRCEAQVCRSAWKVAAGSSRAAALASAIGRSWCDIAQGLPSARSSTAPAGRARPWRSGRQQIAFFHAR